MLTRPWFPPVTALLIVVVTGLIGSYGVHLEQAQHRQDRFNYVVSQVSKYRAVLEGEINASLHLTNGLVAYVSTHPELEQDTVVSMLETLHSQGRHIRNIGLAPGNRVTYVYPLAGNEQVVGLYYPNLPDQWPAIQRAIQERRPNLAGPVKLKQGGIGFIYRVPVFLAPSGTYWGMIGMVIEEQSLLEKAGLAPEVGGLQIALRGKDGKGSEGETFLGAASLFDASDAIKASISLPGGSWQIAARPIDGWSPGHRTAWLRASVWTTAALLGIFTYFALLSLAKQLRAEHAVRRSRDELAEAQRIAAFGSWSIDFKTKTLTWSDETYRIFGIAVGTPITIESFVQCLHPADRDRVLSAWAAAIGGADYSIEHRIVVEGQVKWVSEQAKVEFDAAGNPLSGIGTVLDITGRKQAELDRQDAEERFKLFMDNAPAIAWVKDEEGKHVYLNLEFRERFGADVDTWYGRTDFELWPREVAEKFRANDLAVLASGRPKDIEETACQSNGRVSIWHNVKFPFRNAIGRRFVAGIGIDVTEAYESRRLLQESEERLMEAQRIAQLGNWELDLPTKTISCSDEVFHLLELDGSQGPLTHDTVVDAIHPDDREWVMTAFLQSIQTRRPFDATHRLRVKSDLIKYVHQRGEAVYDDDGRPQRVRGTVQDVTLDKLAEEALRESEQRFKTVADYNYDWEYWRGPNGEILYLSPSCERITGYSQFDFITDPSLTERIVHPDDRERVECHMTDYQDGKEHLLDFRIVTKAGDVRWIAHGCRPVYGHAGKFQGRRVSNRDITDRKLAESALIEAKERLELALGASQLSIWECDIQTGVVFFDESWADMIGLVPHMGSMPTDEVAKHMHPDDWDGVRKAALATFKGSSPSFQVEFRFKTISNAWKWLRCSGKVIERNGEGRALQAIGTAMDITQRKATEEVIRQMAFNDQLTQLPNRRLLEDRLQQFIVRAQREQLGLALLFIDIDKFKPINDELGHEVGDWLLQRIAERMKACLRESDTVARVGGDEFVVVLPDSSTADDALHVAEKIRTDLDQPFISPDGKTLSISSSIGVAIYPDHADNMRDLLRVGDEAMYRAKKAGRNTVVLFRTNLD